MAVGARGQLLSALEGAGWQLLEVRSTGPSGRGNPSWLTLRRGRTRRRVLLYAWNATPEGAGRKRHDEGMPKYRVQTTRSHDGDLMFEPGWTSLGLGWREDWDVFFGFDLWAKRFAGTSSSVFVDPALLHAARDSGWAADVPFDCAQLAFSRSRVDHLFGWLDALAGEPRTVPLRPDRLEPAGPDRMMISVDTRRRTRVTWLRPGDYTVLQDGDGRMSEDLWRVRDTGGERVGSGSNRVLVHLDLERWGTVDDDDWLRA